MIAYGKSFVGGEAQLMGVRGEGFGGGRILRKGALEHRTLDPAHSNKG